MATISAICPTRHPGALVAGIMRALRPAVDEIVIAADSAVGARDLGWYASVADKLVRYEHIGANRHHSWLAAQAGGDWLLLIDGDELPSAALIEALPSLAAHRGVAQHSAPIHWVWPDPGTRLASEPWVSDRRLRLIRNDGRTGFHGRKHMLALDDFPQRHVDNLPVYHLDLLLADAEARGAKAARYDGEAFGVMTPEGRPFNQAFYVPEAHPNPSLEAIPERDRERIEALLGPARQEAQAPLDPAEVCVHDAQAVAWHWAGRSLPEDAYRGSVRLLDPMPPFSAGAGGQQVWARVRNEGTARWPWGWERPPLIRLGVRWRAPDGTLVEMPGRSMLPHGLDPGEETLVPVMVQAPDSPGPWELVVELVHENVRWFGTAEPVAVDVGPSAAERLDALRDGSGPAAVPDVLAVRGALGRRDALVNDLAASPRAPAARLEADLTAQLQGLPMGRWAPDEETLATIAALVRRERPRSILELGSGTSTVLLAILLRELHGPGTAAITSLHEDGSWAALTAAALADRGLDGIATVHHTPLGSPDGEPLAGYLPTEAALSSLKAAPPDLVLVDGPTLDSGASRLGAVDLVQQHLRRPARLLLDDAFRDAELTIAQAWSRRPGVTVDGIAVVGNGLLIGSLQPLGRARGLRRLLQPRRARRR